MRTGVTHARSAPRKKTASQRSVWPLASDLTLPASSHPELVACSTARPAATSISSIFSLCTARPASSVSVGDDLPRPGVDDVAGRRVRRVAVDAERDPAGLIAQLDAGDLLRRHHRRVEDVDAAVGRIAQPEFALVRREADAVARAAVALRPVPSRTRSTSTRCSIFPVVRSPTSKPSRSLTFTKQSVCAPFTVNGRITLPNGPTVRTTACVRASAIDKQRRLQPGEIHLLAIRPVTRCCARPSRSRCVRSDVAGDARRARASAALRTTARRASRPSGEMARRSQPPS